MRVRWQRARRTHSRVLHFGVLLLAHLRQPLYEGDHAPNLLVFVGGAKRRHAGHSDAVLRDPKQLCARPARRDVRQIGRLGIKSFADVSRFLAGRAVAIDAGAGPRCRWPADAPSVAWWSRETTPKRGCRAPLRRR